MSVYDDMKNANLPIDHPDHPFGIDRYREMVNAEIALGHMTVEAGRASGNLDQENAGKMLLGQRWAVSDEENARWQAEIDAMWVWLRALPGINSGVSEEMPGAGGEREDVPVR